MSRYQFLLPLLFLSGACVASADVVIYNITIDTSSQQGNYGYFDIELNPGSLAGTTPVVNATLTNFVGGTFSPSDPNNSIVGSVTGSIPPGPLTLVNSSSMNDYFEGLTFAANLSFALTLSGPGVSAAGTAGGDNGTSFYIDFLNSTQSSYLFSNDPTGSTGGPNPQWAPLVINLDNTGISTLDTNPGDDGGPSVVTASQVPEPATWILLAGPLAALVLKRARRGGVR